MFILEPMTVVTDYILGVLGVVFGVRLWSSEGPRSSSRRLWGGALIAMSLAAFAGGTAHGFADRLGPAGHWILWRVTVWSVGVTSLCLAAVAARLAFARRWARLVVAAFGLQFAFYAVWMVWHDDFRYVIFEYLPAMLFALAAAGWVWLSRGWRGGAWVVAGIGVSLVAAGVQSSGVVLHEFLNHNDLYHLIQMLGVYLLYRGGVHLEDADNRAAG